MIPAAFEYHAPTTLRQALRILRRYPGESKVLAGGHSLLPLMKMRLAQPTHLVDLGNVEDLVFIREQCGFCTPGMIMTLYQALERNPDPTEQEIRHSIAGNMCRCTGYHNIVKAALNAAGKLQRAGS